MASLKAPGICIYCGNPGRLTNEHIVANWIRHIVPRDINEHIYATAHRDRLKGTSVPRREQSREGSLGSRQIRKVCRSCNEGWMRDIQDECKPLLAPLIVGIWAGLNADMASKVARWCTMTVMNIDAGFPISGISKEERHHLFRHRVPPPNWNVWLGRRTGAGAIAYYHRPGFMTSRANPVLTDEPNNSQITTVEIGQLVIHALSFPAGDWGDYNVEYGRDFGIIPILPDWRGDVLDWRYAPFLGGAEVHRLANYLSDGFLSGPIRTRGK